MNQLVNFGQSSFKITTPLEDPTLAIFKTNEWRFSEQRIKMSNNLKNFGRTVRTPREIKNGHAAVAETVTHDLGSLDSLDSIAPLT